MTNEQLIGNYDELVHRRMVFGEISQERDFQEAKWGQQEHLPDVWVRILGEEFGEACQDLNDDNPPGYRKELIQVAAVAVAAIQALDRKTRMKSLFDTTTLFENAKE